MVRIQRPTAHSDKLLIGSDLPDSCDAQGEIMRWVKANGYRVPRNARHLSVFQGDALVREWVLAEPLPERRPVFPFRMFSRRARETSAPRERIA